MRKAWLIGWKDVTLAFRDVAALLLMLVAPFAITLGMGFVTGRFSGGETERQQATGGGAGKQRYLAEKARQNFVDALEYPRGEDTANAATIH